MKNYLFLIICTLSILAAQPGKGGYGKKPPGCEIHGSVIGSISGSAIQYAQISILNNDNSIVYSLHGDGEMQEGQIWEGFMLAPKFNLNNLIIYRHPFFD